MKKLFFIILLFVFAMASAQQITIDETKATVKFNFLEDDVDGTLEGFDFTGSIDLNNLENTTISGTVEMKTLDTNNWLRNRHLRSKKYFNLSDFPKLKFTSTKVERSDTTINVTGILEIKGTEKQVVFSFEKSDKTLRGTAQINSQDFGISIHDAREENNVLVKITLPFK